MTGPSTHLDDLIRGIVATAPAVDFDAFSDAAPLAYASPFLPMCPPSNDAEAFIYGNSPSYHGPPNPPKDTIFTSQLAVSASANQDRARVPHPGAIKGDFSTLPEHMPASHRAHREWTPAKDPHDPRPHP